MSVTAVASGEEPGSLTLLALGLRGALERFDALLAKYVAADPADVGDDVPPLDDATAVVLGAIAIAVRLTARLDEVPQAQTRPALPDTSGGEWLR